MSLAEEMLANMSVSDDSASYLTGQEGHIVINESRTAIVPAELKTIAVTGDKDIETVTFDCVRYWDGNDLSTFAIYLNYVLPDKTVGTYIPEAITTSEGEGVFHFDWKIKNNITTKSGKISFAITAIKTKQNENGENVVDKQWSSLPNGDCSIALGLNIENVPDNEEAQNILSQMSAILEQIHADVDEWIKTALVQEVGDSEEKAMSQKATTVAIEDAKSYARSYTDDKSVKLNADIQKNYQIAIRNSKRITNLEQGIPAELFETDDTVAYQKDVPSNARSYAMVSNIGGMTYKNGDTLKSAKVTAVKSVGANLIPYPYAHTTQTVNGITFIDNGDGTITANGTATNTAFFILSKVLSLPSGNYYISDAVNKAGAYVQAGSGKYNTGINVDGAIDGIELRVASGTTLNNVVFKPMLNKGSTAMPYTPYVENTLPIPDAVQALEGYGQGNPDDTEEYNAIIWDEDGTRKYLHMGNFVDGVWVAFPNSEVTDISDLITSDNLIGVEGNGTITFENEYGYSVPSEVTYQLKGATA